MRVSYEGIPVSLKSSCVGFIFQKMPPYLSAHQFSDWHGKINNLVKSIGLPDSVASDITIVFSDKEESRVFGSLSVEEAKRKIRDHWVLNECANALLDELHTPSDFHENQSISSLAEAINASNPEETYASVRTQLEDIFSMVAFNQLVLGEYIHPKTIVLYTKNIEKTQLSPGEKRTLEQIFEEVFAHEMFHAYHYQNEPKELTERRDYTSRVVKESLAAAFEWHYCVTYKIPHADDLRYEWARYSVVTYPYSGAKKFLQPLPGKAKIDFDKATFCDLFQTSLLDMDTALRLLLEAKQFYQIKNIIYIREKVITVPTIGITYADFEAMFAGEKVGQIAKKEIPPIVAKKPHIVTELLDDGYCKTTFCTSDAVLSITQKHYPCGNPVYYANTKAVAAGNGYYLFMHWREKHRKPLLKWLWANRA